jgi:hypothetical protein
MSVTAAEMAKMLAGVVHALMMATSNGPTTPASAAADPLIPITSEICSGSAISRYDAAIAGIKSASPKPASTAITKSKPNDVKMIRPR